MLSSKNKNNGHYDTVISGKSELIGDIHCSGGLQVEGRIKGNIIADEQSGAVVRISESGTVEGDIRAPKIIVNGRVMGNIYTGTHIELAAKAMVSGDVHYTMMEMVMGAQVNGNLIHEGTEKSRKGRKNVDPVIQNMAQEAETKVD